MMTEPTKLIKDALDKGQRALSEHGSKQLLQAYGISVTRETLVGNPDDAVAAAKAIGYPVALKACSAELMHKTEAAGIVLGIRDATELREAYQRVVTAVGLDLEGVLIQEMIAGQREVVLGLSRDPQFGPCVMFGLGGIMTEIINDTVFRVAPFDHIEALDMLSELRSRAILDDFRGQAPADRETICAALMALGQIGLDHGAVAEIDPARCNNCGRCQEVCRFEAVLPGEECRRIDPVRCEGCGACRLVCPAGAIAFQETANGRWFISGTRFGTMSHAQLGIAEENSGRLVTLVRQNAQRRGQEEGREAVLIDGAPGTGCPVIASLAGVRLAVAVTEPTVSGLHDLERILALCAHFRVPTGVVINKADLNSQLTRRIRQLARERGAVLLGEIPYDERFTAAQSARKTLLEHDPHCPAARAVKLVWERMNTLLPSPAPPAKDGGKTPQRPTCLPHKGGRGPKTRGRRGKR